MRSGRAAEFLLVALAAVVAQPAFAQPSTVLIGTITVSGTRNDCNPNGTSTPYSATGTFDITLEPALSSLVEKGGAVTGTANSSGTETGCSGPEAVGAQFTVTGMVDPGGAMTLSFTFPSTCTFDAVGTVNEIGGTIPSSCFDHLGIGTFVATTQGLKSSPGLSVGPSELSFSCTRGSASPATQSIQVSNGGSQAAAFSVTTSGESWLSVAPESGSVLSSTDVAVAVNPAGLAPGTYVGNVTIVPAVGPSFPVAISATVNAAPDTLVLSQTSLRFQAAAGSGPAPGQSVQVLGMGAHPLTWKATASTLKGNWLSVTPASGRSGSSATITADATNLEPGDYYGLVEFTAPGAANSPHSVVVVFNVSAAMVAVPSVQPTALIFVDSASGITEEPQELMVTNSSNQPVTFTETVVSQQNGLVTSGNNNVPVTVGRPVPVSVSATGANLTPGVYFATIEFKFSDGSSQPVEIVVIVTPAAPADSQQRAHDTAPASCTPTVLLPVSTALGQSFNAVAAWPVPLQIQVVDDCGNPMQTGSVVASFSSSDPSLALVSLGNGNWSGTWQPGNVSTASSVAITIQAESAQPALSGTLVLAGTTQPNGSVPQVFPAAVVSAASFASYTPLAPGAFASIFGKHLANSSVLASSLPLATEMAGTQVQIAGRLAPIDYASDGQLNVLLPYDLTPNSAVQVIVLQGLAYSLPQSVTIAPSQPAVFSQNQSGQGPGAITVVKPDGTQFPADAANPASAGDSLVIYCSGLGAVNPAVTAGSAAPVPAAKATTPITVTIGGHAAAISFAGLTPTYAGLYQVNVTVPSGIAPGPSVPVALTGAGLTSPPVTVAIK